MKRSSAWTLAVAPPWTWESQRTSQQMNAVIVVPAGVGTEQLTTRGGLGARRSARAFARGLRVDDARRVRRRRGPRAEPESIPARVRAR